MKNIYSKKKKNKSTTSFLFKKVKKKIYSNCYKLKTKFSKTTNCESELWTI